VSEAELREAIAEVQALRDRMQGELSFWDELCRQFIERKDEIHKSMQICNRVLEALAEKVEAEGDGADWWKG
jgi:hypothetical protein